MKELKSWIIASLKGNHNECFGVFISNCFKYISSTLNIYAFYIFINSKLSTLPKITVNKLLAYTQRSKVRKYFNKY